MENLIKRIKEKIDQEKKADLNLDWDRLEGIILHVNEAEMLIKEIERKETNLLKKLRIAFDIGIRVQKTRPNKCKDAEFDKVIIKINNEYQK